MAYQRKTKDVWILEGKYDGEWCCLLEEETRNEAWEQFRVYTKNEPFTEHRVRKIRERL